MTTHVVSVKRNDHITEVGFAQQHFGNPQEKRKKNIRMSRSLFFGNKSNLPHPNC